LLTSWDDGSGATTWAWFRQANRCDVGRIAVEILRPSETYKLDVRDKDINRFGEYVGGSVLSVGMLVPFVLTLASADHFWVANAMYATFALSAVVGNATKLVAYRRGL